MRRFTIDKSRLQNLEAAMKIKNAGANRLFDEYREADMRYEKQRLALADFEELNRRRGLAGSGEFKPKRKELEELRRRVDDALRVYNAARDETTYLGQISTICRRYANQVEVDEREKTYLATFNESMKHAAERAKAAERAAKREKYSQRSTDADVSGRTQEYPKWPEN